MKGRKRFAKKPKVSKAVKSYVSKKLDAEIEDKHIYGETGTGTLNNTTQIAATHLTLPAQGIGWNERLGTRIKIKYIRIALEARSSGASNIVNWNTKNQHFRVMLVRMNKTNSGALVTAGTNQGLFQTTVAGAGYSIALPNPVACTCPGDGGNSEKLYTVLFDKSYPMELLYQGATLDSTETMGSMVKTRIFKKYSKGLHVNFTAATTGASASIQDYSHYLIYAIGNTAADDTYSYSYNGHYDIMYEDA